MSRNIAPNSKAEELKRLEEELGVLEAELARREGRAHATPTVPQASPGALSKEEELKSLEEELGVLEAELARRKQVGEKGLLSKSANTALNLGKGIFHQAGGLAELVKTLQKGQFGSDIDDIRIFRPTGSIDPVTGEKDLLKRREEAEEAVRQAIREGALDKINLYKESGKLFDKIVGREVKPENRIDEAAHFAGELLPIIPGSHVLNALKWGGGTVGGAELLKTAGVDKEKAELASSIMSPLLFALKDLPPRAFNYIASLINEDFRKGMATEKAAEFLKSKVGKENIPDVVSKIEDYRSPFPGDLMANESPYRPFTASIADNVGLSQYHRSKAENIPRLGNLHEKNKEVLRREANKLAEGISPQVAQEFVEGERGKVIEGLTEAERKARSELELAERQFDRTATPTEAGTEVQDYLHNRVEDIRREAQERAKPSYTAAEARSLEELPRTFEYLGEQLKELAPVLPSHKDLQKAKQVLEHARIGENQQNLKINSKYGANKNLQELINNAYGNRERSLNYNVGRLNIARKGISKLLAKIPYQERERRAILEKVIDNLDKDMESIPEIFQARAIYREAMTPANFITEHPVLGRLIKREDGYVRPFTVGPAEIPRAITHAEKSEDAARLFMSHYVSGETSATRAQHAGVVNTVRSYINSDILHNFVNRSGRIDPHKFDAWRRNNPGAFILDPQLNNKLDTLEHAQAYVNQVMEQNRRLLREFDGEVVRHFLGNKFEGMNPNKIAKKILGSSNSEKVMGEAVELLSKDKSGKAVEGLRRGIVDDLFGRFKSDNFTFAKFNDYINQNQGALGKAFDADQMKVLYKIREILKNEAATGTAGIKYGSDTIPKLMENLAEKTGEEASKALVGHKFFEWKKKINKILDKTVEAEKVRILQEALINPKMAKFLLTKDFAFDKKWHQIRTLKDFGKYIRQKGKGEEDFFKNLKDNRGIISKNIILSSVNKENE